MLRLILGLLLLTVSTSVTNAQSFHFNADTGAYSFTGLIAEELPFDPWVEDLILDLEGDSLRATLRQSNQFGGVSTVGPFTAFEDVSVIESLTITTGQTHTTLNVGQLAGWDIPVVIDLGVGVDTVVGEAGLPDVTIFGQPGDFDGDGDVDIGDIRYAESLFGENGVNASARADWILNFGAGDAGGEGPSIPEPGAAVLCVLVMAMATMVCFRRRCDRRVI